MIVFDHHTISVIYVHHSSIWTIKNSQLPKKFSNQKNNSLPKDFKIVDSCADLITIEEEEADALT